MKKFNVLFIALVLMMSMLFIGCDMFGGEGDVIVNPYADDGFGLDESNIPFNASTSVSDVDAVSTAQIFAPVELTGLETGSDPTIYFTFNKGIRSIFNFDGTTISQDMPEDHTFKISSRNSDGTFTAATDIDVKSYAISGSKVTFTFEAETFDADDKVTVLFGVVSSAGEYYYVNTFFQPQVNIIETTTLAHDFSDYYAYAIDSDKVFILNNAVAKTCEDPAEPVDTIDGMGSFTSGTDFGEEIDSLALRATGTGDDHDNNVYSSLQDLEDNGTIHNYISLTFEPVEYANDYVFYRYDAEGNFYEVDFVTVDPNNGESYINETEITGEINDEGEVISYTINFYFEDDPIEAGDYVYLVPANTRGEFDDCSATYPLVDSVQPYAYTTLTTDVSIDTDMATEIHAAGPDYSTHDERVDDTWGHLSAFDTFNVLNPTGTEAWNTIEGVEVALESVSNIMIKVMPGQTAPTDGGLKSFSRDAFIEYFEGDVVDGGLGLDSDDFTILSNSAGTAWFTLNGTTLTTYLGFFCSDGTNGINYSGTQYQVYGDFNFNITDASGNDLIFTDDDTSTEVTNGNVTLNFTERS